MIEPSSEATAPAAAAGQSSAPASKERETLDSRRRRYLRSKLKKASSDAERTAIREEFATKYGITEDEAVMPAPSTARAESPAAAAQSSAAAPAPTHHEDGTPLEDWEDPNRPYWPKPAFIDHWRPHVANAMSLVAPALDGTRFSLEPRTAHRPDGTEVQFKPQDEFAEAIAAVLGKRMPPSGAQTPEGALIKCAVMCWGMPILLERLTKALEAKARLQEAQNVAAGASSPAPANVHHFPAKPAEAAAQ